MVDRDVRTPRASSAELLVAPGGDDRPEPEGTTDLERRGCDPTTDAPDQGPLALGHRRLRDEHPVGGLVHERECRGLLERQCVVERDDLFGSDSDQLRMRPVAVLADHRDEIPVLQPWVDHDTLTWRERRDTLADRLDHTGAVGAEDARLRYRWKPFPHPDVEVVERRGMDPDEHLAGAGLGVGRVLVPQHLRATVLVNPDGLHGTILS